MVFVVYDGLGFNPPSTSFVLTIIIVCEYGRVDLEAYCILLCNYIENPNEISSSYLILSLWCVTGREMLLTTSYAELMAMDFLIHGSVHSVGLLVFHRSSNSCAALSKMEVWMRGWNPRCTEETYELPLELGIFLTRMVAGAPSSSLSLLPCKPLSRDWSSVRKGL